MDGFTLIEIMICIAILGTLAAIAIPNYFSYINRGRVARAIGDIKAIENPIQQFYLINDRYPDSLAQVGLGGIKDPWGNAYRYLRIEGNANPGKGKLRKDHNLVPVNSDFDLYSMGKDEATNSTFTAKVSEDDIVRANNGGYVGLVSEY